MKRFLLIALSAASLIASAASAQVTQPPSGSTIGTVTTVTNPVGIKGADGSGIAADANPVPVSGTVTAAQATASSLNATVVGTGTFATQSTLQAGSAIAGKFGIDQTTPGTTNGVQVNAALPAGTALIGKVGIDQTTPGTTNKVSIGTDGTVAATQSGTWNITNLSGTVSLPTGASTAALQSSTYAPITPATATATSSQLLGCAYLTTLGTFTNTQQGAASCDSRGKIYTVLSNADSTTAAVVSTPANTMALAGALRTSAIGMIYNGSSMDLWLEALTGLNTTGTGIPSTALAGECDDTSQTALTENRFGNVRVSCTNHSLIVRPFESAANSWQVSVTLSDTTNTALHASCGAGLKNYVTNLDYSSVATTVADELDLNDNATAIWKQNVAAGAGGRAFEWLTPKVGTAATAMNAQLTGSPTGAVIVNASGYCAP